MPPQAGVTVPHNGLLSDLYLENYAWKRLIVNALRARELPLWNPYVFAGVPFWAAGQHSALYPLSALFYILPIPAAYGWFAALHLFLAGAWTYLLARTLALRRAAAMLAGVAFMFSGFMVTHNVFPMIMAAIVWLPLILAVIERIVRRAEREGVAPVRQIPGPACGRPGPGDGHLWPDTPRCTIMSVSSRWPLPSGAWLRCCGRAASLAALLAGVAPGAMGLVGLGLGTAQWLPLLDLVRYNFRQGSAGFREVLGWAYPLRRVIALLIPDFFGNPSHHSYLDLFSWRQAPVTVNALGQPIDTIYWGIKNYVEGASYLGVLPALLAVVAILRRRGRHLAFFALLALVSLALCLWLAPLHRHLQAARPEPGALPFPLDLSLHPEHGHPGGHGRGSRLGRGHPRR